MSITPRQMNEDPARFLKSGGLCLLCLALISPLSVALADPPSATIGQQPSLPPQMTIDPSGLVHDAANLIEGVAMTIDSEGHVRALCADPADSLAPAAMRDAIRPDVSRLRYE